MLRALKKVKPRISQRGGWNRMMNECVVNNINKNNYQFKTCAFDFKVVKLIITIIYKM